MKMGSLDKPEIEPTLKRWENLYTIARKFIWHNRWSSTVVFQHHAFACGKGRFFLFRLNVSLLLPANSWKIHNRTRNARIGCKFDEKSQHTLFLTSGASRAFGLYGFLDTENVPHINLAGCISMRRLTIPVWKGWRLPLRRRFQLNNIHQPSPSLGPFCQANRHG